MTREAPKQQVNSTRENIKKKNRLVSQPAVTGDPRACTICTSKISEVGGISSTCLRGLHISDHTF